MSTDKIKIENLCNNSISFAKVESMGDVYLLAHATTKTVTEDEIEAQVSNNNKLFTGTDGRGSHARIYIHDESLRQRLGFESTKEEIAKSKTTTGNKEDIIETQNVLTNDKLNKIFNGNPKQTQATFEKLIKEAVKTSAEKDILVKYTVDNKVNNVEQVKFIEKYTGKTIL